MTEQIFFVGVDSDKYYSSISKLTMDDEIKYLFDNSDVENKYYENLHDAYDDMFNTLQEMLPQYFYNDNEEINNKTFFYHAYITKPVYINDIVIKSAAYHNFIFCKIRNDKRDNIFLLTDELYNNYHKKLGLVCI
jgi:hypothetical protein